MTQILRRSVITSSSCREIDDLFAEVKSIVDADVEFDLSTLREPDVSAIQSEYGNFLRPQQQACIDDPLSPAGFTNIMADEANQQPITDWVLHRCKLRGVRVAALATYFPDICSAYLQRRKNAIAALVNAVRLALRLVDENVSNVAIVELVCGSILDPCECGDCRKSGRTFVSEVDAKLDLLISSLVQVVRTVRELQDKGDVAKKPYALGVELEPGEIYVLRDTATLNQFFVKLDEQCSVDEREERPLELRSHIGLNLDIAHMRIAQVEKTDLVPHVNRIVHAHISDHPGMHTRDQAVGTWTSVDRWNNEFRPYIELLYERLGTYALDQQLPFSGAIALELEGCNRIAWIFQSLSAMKRLIQSGRCVTKS